MATGSSSSAQTRAHKRPRTQAELAAQAAVFGADWQRGDKVMTWIRRHEAIGGELTGLVRDGWSWADVGRAMALAGIKYETRSALSSAILQRKAAKARQEERKRCAALAGLSPAAWPVAQTGTALPAPSPVLKPAPVVTSVSPSAVQPAFADGEPQFRPARLASHWSGWKSAKQQDPPPAAQSLAAGRMDVDTAAVIARLLGKK